MINKGGTKVEIKSRGMKYLKIIFNVFLKRGSTFDSTKSATNEFAIR